MLVDDEMNVWLEDFPMDSLHTNRWCVFDSTGVWSGSVTLPEGLAIFEIGTDYVLGKMEDELGVERVMAYALVRQ